MNHRIQHAVALALMLAIGGCATQTYEARPLQPEVTLARFEARTLDNPELVRYMIEQGYPENSLPVRVWGMRELSLAAFHYHPQLDVARAQWRAAAAGEITAAQRPNPGVSFKQERHDSNHDNGISPWSYSIGFDIPLETAGKRQARIDRAANLSEASRIQIAQQAWQVRSQVRQALLNYQQTQEQVALLQRESALREEIVDMLQHRLQAGMVSDIDLGNARLQLQKTQQQLDAERGRLPEHLTQIAAAVGVPASALNAGAIAADTTLLSAEQLPPRDVQRAAMLNRLELRSALARYAAAEARLRLEIARQYPDLVLSPGYMFDQGDDIWSLGFSLLMPLLNRNAGPIAEAAAQRELEARQFEAQQAGILAEQEQALARYRAALEEKAKAEKVLSAQQQRIAQTTRLFDAGFSDRLELALARLEGITAEQGLHAAMTRARRALASLENAVQQPLDDTPLPTPPEMPTRSAKENAS